MLQISEHTKNSGLFVFAPLNNNYNKPRGGGGPTKRGRGSLRAQQSTLFKQKEMCGDKRVSGV